MSFLSHASHPALFAASIGGLVLGVSLIFAGKSVSPMNTKSFMLASGESNCEVVNDFQEVARELSLTSSHVHISCRNKGIEEENDHPLEDRWSALFPIVIFKKYDDNLVIKTETDAQELGRDHSGKTYITRFKSDWFTHGGEVVGAWDYSEERKGGKLVHTVEVKERGDVRIYFVQLDS